MSLETDWEEFEEEMKDKNEPSKAQSLPSFPKEEEVSEEELDRILEERYKSGSKFVTYADDNNYETKRSVDRNAFVPLSERPAIWKVKCMVDMFY